MGQNNTIELNGKLYDATTGALLGESRIKATPHARNQLYQRQSRTIDGFIRNSERTANLPTVSKPVASVSTTLSNTKSSKGAKHFDIQRQSKAHLKAHQPERPKTLMRRVVSKPKHQLKPAIKTAGPAEVMARPVSSLAKPLQKKLSVTQVSPTRLARSKSIAKSHHVRRFSRADTRPHAIAPISSATSLAPRPVTLQRPVLARQSQHMATVAKSKPSTTDIFEAALAHANSHEQTTPRHAPRHSLRRQRFVNVMAGIGAFLLIGGFIAYLNLTTIELRVASMRAGFTAQVPSYQPEGYNLVGNIESSQGKVAMSFRSGDRGYTLTQEASDWNSRTLLDQTLSDQGEPSQTIESGGRTIYIYDGSNATWVNGGIHYQLSGDAPLDTDEIVELATSM